MAESSRPFFRRQYCEDDSLVLVGFVGAGKKTLGIIASVALRRRFVDFEVLFRQEAGSLPQQYIAVHGLAAYRTIEAKVSQQLITTHAKGCVIVGLGAVASSHQQLLLQEFARGHPVIYVRRAVEELRQFVTAKDDKFTRFYHLGNIFFESCSNLEFYNITHEGNCHVASLKLKDTETQFVRFLHRIFGHEDRLPFSSELFSSLHTFALQVPAQWLHQTTDLEGLETGADAIALIITLDSFATDGLQADFAHHMATLRKHSRVPVIVDVRPLADTDADIYVEVQDMLLRLAPDAITCFIDRDPKVVRRLNASKGRTRTIATYHQNRPLEWRNQSCEVSCLPRKAEDLGFDALRVTGESYLLEDNLACIASRQSLVLDSNIPLIMYNTGMLGRTSICLNPTLSPVTLPEIDLSGVTVEEAHKALTACFLSPKKRFVIVGQAVQHSLSPLMHNAAYVASGLLYKYDAVQVNTLSQIHPLLDDEDTGGVAISRPYKTAILPFLDDISVDANNINAANTIVVEKRRRPDGTQYTTRRGYNTDFIGIKNCLHKHLSTANAIRDGTTALIIGAGGMARAAIYSCYELGIRRVCIHNRTVENALQVAGYYQEWARRQSSNFQLEVIKSVNDKWPPHFRRPTIVVCCLPGYQHGSESPIDVKISDQWLASPTGGVFLDVSYGSKDMPLVDQVLNHASRGWIVVDGLALLIEQGIAQYELFTSRPAPIHIMRRALHDTIYTPYTNIDTCKMPCKMPYEPAIMSASLGRAWLHDLDYKINQAGTAGFKGIEIFYEDLDYAARKLSKSDNAEPEHLFKAADHIHTMCEANGLEIIGLQPFLFYEGLKDRQQHARLIEKMKLWLQIAKRLRTTIIQIPANFLPAAVLTDDLDVIVSDLRQVADMGALEAPVVCFAYENLCWSTHVDTVEKLWDVIRRVDRPNFGVCLDTFNIAGRVWADPASDTGKTNNADADLKRTLDWMVKEIDVAKVFYIQVIDAEKMREPLLPGHPFHVDGQPPRMNWSRNARTFMYEEDRGAYLPAEEVAKTIISGLKYEGYVSMELFSRTMSEEGERVPVEHAQRGITAWRKTKDRLQLE
ncbi:hypothetical protein BJX99DRAFT_249717 [Aspergillus californicus]